MAADIFESYEVTIVSGLILGVALVMATGDLEVDDFPAPRTQGIVSLPSSGPISYGEAKRRAEE